jgi:hypothetical protein
MPSGEHWVKQMNPLLLIRSWARQQLTRLHHQPDVERRRNIPLREAIDMVVAGTDPRIRAVVNHGRKLKPAVARMLAYLDSCGGWFAAPSEISAHAWNADPLVHALFANAAELQQLFSRDQELRAYFREHPGCQEVFVGLGVTCREQHTLGVALNGDLLQREVAQTVLNFTDHQVFDACGSESELRANVERRGFGFLVGEALERIVERSRQRRGLEEQQHLLQLELKALEHKRGAVDMLSDAAGSLDERIAQLREQVVRGQQTIGQEHAHHTTLEDYITCINEVLGHPEKYLMQKQVSLRVNRMNIKVYSPSEAGDQLLFTEITIGRRTPRVVLLGRFPRADLLPERDPLDEAQRLLGP